MLGLSHVQIVLVAFGLAWPMRMIFWSSESSQGVALFEATGLEESWLLLLLLWFWNETVPVGVGGFVVGGFGFGFAVDPLDGWRGTRRG